MATMTKSPQATSPSITARSPLLPPIVTTPLTKKSSTHRPTSYAQRRISGFSTSSKRNPSNSRPISQVFPAFHSSLPFSFVRDFAYPANYPLHYGPQPDASGVATPASERSRRLSDPEMTGWDDSRPPWSATGSWMGENNSAAAAAASYISGAHSQLPAMTYSDGGPPYEEDEDLQSPVVTSSRHRKKRSQDGARPLEDNEEYHPLDNEDDMNGPGGEIETYPTAQTRRPQHRDSNFAKPLERFRSPYNTDREVLDEEEDQGDLDQDPDEYMEDDDEDDATRYSKDYSFTIASPDEEMHGKAIALFDFAPEHVNELALQEGQIILVSYRHDQGWLVAEDPATKEVGLVPEDFVRLVRHIEGGLNGLKEIGVDGVVDEDTMMMTTTTTQHEPPEIQTPVVGTRDENYTDHNTPRPSQGEMPRLSTGVESYPATQSNFSTSSKDFSPLKTSREQES